MSVNNKDRMEGNEVNTSQSIVSTNTIEGGSDMMDLWAEGVKKSQEEKLAESRIKFPGIDGKDSPETLLLIEKQKKYWEDRDKQVSEMLDRDKESMKTDKGNDRGNWIKYEQEYKDEKKRNEE
jgi:hypothetical protein